MATRINRYLDSVSTFDNLEIDLIRFPSNVLRRANQDLTEMIESIRENGSASTDYRQAKRREIRSRRRKQAAGSLQETQTSQDKSDGRRA